MCALFAMMYMYIKFNVNNIIIPYPLPNYSLLL